MYKKSSLNKYFIGTILQNTFLNVMEIYQVNVPQNNQRQLQNSLPMQLKNHFFIVGK